MAQLHKRGQQLWLVGLKFPVSLSWYDLKRDDGKARKKIRAIHACHLKLALLLGGVSADGRRRVGLRLPCYRFSLHRFGQATQLGIYHFLVLSFIAYLLAHWAYLSTASTALPDWGQAARVRT